MNTMSEKGFARRFLGVLAGNDMPPETVAAWAKSADFVIAADGGADTLIEQNFVPAATVGDGDSIHPNSIHKLPNVLFDSDQETTDCDKLLARAEQLGARSITLCAVEGDLFDHTLATMYSSARSGLNVRLALRRGIAMVIRGPKSLTYEWPVGTRLSLMPLAACTGVFLTGVEWTLEDQEMTPADAYSVSNRVVGPVRVTVASGVAVLFGAHPELEAPSWDDE